MTDTKPKESYTTALKPLQTVSYNDKVKDNYRWAKENICYLLDHSDFRIRATENAPNKKDLYDAYNNQINTALFDYVTNPLNSKDARFKSFPAKLRSYNILRPNIDLLIGEWCKKPFKYDVLNMDGNDVFNSFNEYQSSVFRNNVTQRVINTLNEIKATVLPSQEIPNPEDVQKSLANYKDAKAIDGYRSLKVLEFELGLREKLKRLLKDFLIAGDCYSYKNVAFNEVVYNKLSTLGVDFDKSTVQNNIEDGDWATAKYRITVSELVDLFYDDLKEADIIHFEQNDYANRSRLYIDLSGGSLSSDLKDRNNKVDLFYATWKSRRKIGILTYLNSMTNEWEETEVDESYIPDKEKGEKVEWMWVNEVWQGWRAGDDKFFGIGPVPVQRNEINNFSACKLPINGRRFSDTESDNTSIARLGMPYQIMYIILMYRIELALAKSKGTMVLLDKNTIPDVDENGDSLTLYYAEALGYMLIDRSGDDVDKGWNQYQKIDFSQFNIIQQMIQLAMFFKQEWDELLGITRQRKGQTQSSDGLGTTQAAIFRSTVISDIIFSTFDEFVESELQGLLDLSKFAWIDGKKSYLRNDDGRIELFNIDPVDHANASLGIFVDSVGRNTDKLELLKNQINAIAQRKDVKLSTIADLIYLDSYAEIKNKLEQIEQLDLKLAQAQAQNEQEMEETKRELEKEYEAYRNMLDIEKLNAEWDRRDNNEYIKAQVENLKPGDTVDISAIEKAANDRLKIAADARKVQQQEETKRQVAVMKDLTERLKIKASLKNKVVGEK